MHLQLTLDHRSVSALLDDLLTQLIKQERRLQVSRFMLHMVGATLVVCKVAPQKLQHRAASNGPINEEWVSNYFGLNDTTLYCVSSPTEALMRQCAAVLTAQRHPFIITLRNGVIAAQLLAENIGIADRLDIIDFEQFMAANIHEHSRFDLASRRTVMQQLVTHYNHLIETLEGGDGRLKIALA